jgi:hypothetical protein
MTSLRICGDTEPSVNETRVKYVGLDSFLQRIKGVHQDGLELTSQDNLGKNPLTWKDVQHVAQKSSKDTGSNPNISGEIFLGRKNRTHPDLVCIEANVRDEPKRESEEYYITLQRSAKNTIGADGMVETNLTGADVTTVLDRQSCVLGTVNCNNSP